MVTREIYLARYLDYKFRPAVQVSDDDIAKYYQEQLVPALTAKGEKIPRSTPSPSRFAKCWFKRESMTARRVGLTRLSRA